MTPEAIHQLVRDYLELVEADDAHPDACEAKLIRTLDRLAAAMHDAPGGRPSDVDAPRYSYDAARALASARFPDFGYYCAPSGPEEDVAYGDAIDDLADIYLDLRCVDWMWSNQGAEAALWELHESYRSHWGRHHLRGLQSYLCRRRSG